MIRRSSSSLALASVLLLLSISVITLDLHQPIFVRANQFKTADAQMINELGWIAVWDTLQNDTGYGIDVSGNGLIYIAGVSSDDALLLKYDALGQQLWNRTWGGTGLECAYAVTVNAMNEAYIVGFTTSWGAGKSDAFIAKFDPYGNVLWSQTWGDSGEDKAQGVCSILTGEVYMCGSLENTATSSFDIFVVSYDSNGNIKSETVLEADGDQEASDIMISSDNTIFLAGTGQQNTESDFDMMLIALGSDGNEKFSEFWGYDLNDSAYALDIAEDGNILISGYYSQPGWAAAYIEFNSTGSVVDAKLYEPEEFEGESFWGYDIMCANYAAVYVVGKTTTSGRVYQINRNWGGEVITDSSVENVYFGIAQRPSEDIYLVGEGTFDLSTKFVRLEHYWPFSSPMYKDEIVNIWKYAGDGVASELTVADFTGDGVKEVVSVFYTIERQWVDVIENNTLLWSFLPGVNATQLSTRGAQLDTDPLSELLVWYRIANFSESSLVALDNDGSYLWHWQGNLTDQPPVIADLDSDQVDEICLGLVDGIELLGADSSVRWKIEGDANTTWSVYSSGDFNLDGRADLVTSMTDNSAIPSTLQCILLDATGTVLAQFPMLFRGVEGVGNATGDALTITMSNFFGESNLGFYYVTTNDSIHISELIVNSQGEPVGWSSPWSEWRNLTWYESSKVIICDINEDTVSEILRMTPYGDLYLMDSFGRIIWISHTFPNLLWMTPNSNSAYLSDFDGDTKPDLLTTTTIEATGLFQIEEICIIDPQTGYVRYLTLGSLGDAQSITDIDGDGTSEILVTNVYYVSVARYGVYQQPNWPYSIGALIIMLPIIAMIALVAVFFYDYSRKLSSNESST